MITGASPFEESPTASQLLVDAHATSVRRPTPAGIDCEVHLLPPSVVASNEPLSKVLAKPTAKHTFADGHATPDSVKALGTRTACSTSLHRRSWWRWHRRPTSVRCRRRQRQRSAVSRHRRRRDTTLRPPARVFELQLPTGAGSRRGEEDARGTRSDRLAFRGRGARHGTERAGTEWQRWL